MTEHLDSPATPSAESTEPIVPAMSRRRLLLTSGATGIAGAAIGAAAGVLSARAAAEPKTTPEVVSFTGTHQAGVASPVTPQEHVLVLVADVDVASAKDSLAALGARILRLTTPFEQADGETKGVLPDGPGNLTVFVGVGSRVLAAAQPDLAAVVEMPLYIGDDELTPDALGGDLLISIQADNAAALESVAEALAAEVEGFRLRWRQLGYSGPNDQGITRNPFGYHDGIIVARTPEEQNDDVWIADGPLAGGTICVIRRFALDVTRFRAEPQARQDAIIGRERATGVPLSGGAMRDDADITLRTPDGAFVIGSDSHIRAAHPSFTGSGLMLRRSYAYSQTGLGVAPERGLLFTCFQNEVRTFVRTQQRMDDIDALMGFSTPTATCAFAILPGFDADHPLGSTLV
jgi:dye decolorizing peroxidase